MEGVMEKRLFHYTTRYHLNKILESRAIEPAREFIPDSERPAVWLTYRDSWEPTATKGIIDPHTEKRRDATLQEMIKHAGGLVRIEVDPASAPLTWPDFCVASGCARLVLLGLYESAVEKGSDPKQWRTSFAPISEDSFLDIEFLEDVESNLWKSFVDSAHEKELGLG